MTDKILIDRAVVGQALEACSGTLARCTPRALQALRAALEQLQDHTEQHLGMVPTGWKLVPEEPTPEMLDAYVHMQGRFSSARSDWAAMLAAAPQPPVVEQEPKCVAIVEVFGTNWRLDYMSLPVGRHKLYTQQYNYTHPQPPVVEQHTDDAAVNRFAEAMKAKMAVARSKGRGGWDDPEQCTVEYLAKLLVDHIAKGDPVDVANFAMMLHQRHADKSVLSAAAPTPPMVEQEPVAWMCTETGVLYSTDTGKVDKHHGFTPTVPLYAHPQPRQPLTDELQDAFFEGFCAVETYNDTRLNSVEEEWEKYKTAHGIGGEK